MEALKLYRNKTVKPVKGKTTFNISVPILEILENTRIILRRQQRDKVRITKTLIVERAIELAMQDLERNGEESAQYQNII
jgi:hypothetical protein